MKQSLKLKMSLTVTLIVLATVAIITAILSIFINQLFKNYLIRQQENKLNQIVSSLSQQYIENDNNWNSEVIHAIGMFALNDGYLLKINDKNDLTFWDAQKHEMQTCSRIMNDISKRMKSGFSDDKGGFSTINHDILVNNELIGSVEITYWGPYFLSVNDLNFLKSVTPVLIIVAIVSVVTSFIVGSMISRRLIKPILKTVDATKQIADGNYKVKITEDTNTKELDNLIHSINHMSDSLVRQENLRKKLTEDISHELRTPIAILQSHFEAIISGIWEPTIERLESCNDEIKKLGSMVCVLENLAKIDNENIKLTMTNFDLLEIVNRVTSSFEATLHNKNLKVTVTGKSLNINADEEKIGQVMTNLLSNAIKYTDDGDEIKIEISETAQYATIKISDNGIGIPESELPFIFERFYRTDKSRSRKTGGSGLGLSIVKSIVEAHGGEIKVESIYDEGSYFLVVLPKNLI